MNRTYSFFFHYNKPASVKSGRPQITVHHKGICYIVDNLKCKVMTHGKIRKSQPRFVVAGKANSVIIKDGIAIIE